MTTHPIVHVEFSARDLQAAGKFYADLFGWKLQPTDMNYVLFETGVGPGGGFTPIDGEQVKAGDVIVYVSTDDIEATLSRIEALGGRTLVPKTEIPGAGWFALFADPSGNRVGLYTTAAPQA